MNTALFSDKTIEIAGQTARTKSRVQYSDLVGVVMVLARLLVAEDIETGAPITDKLSYKPIALLHILSTLTDMNMSKYTTGDGDMYALVDDFEDAPESTRDVIWALYDEVEDMYRPVERRRVEEIRDKNSVAAQLRQMMRGLMGSGDGKDAGMVRLLLTDLLMKTRREDRESGGGAPLENIIDLSEFKPRK